MDSDLLPKHFTIANWLIKLRWVAIVLLLSGTFLVKNILNISIQDTPIYFLSLSLIILNATFFSLLKEIKKKGIIKFTRFIRQIIHFQIGSDLIILTLVLHFSGGIENPFVIYYIFHMIIVSTILTPIESYLQTVFAIILIGTAALLECFSIIPHYPLIGFISHSYYQDTDYLFGTGCIFIATSFFIVGITNSIVSKSRENEIAYLKANLALKEKDKLKNEYVLHVTHDIKGHIAAIDSCLKVLKTNILGELNQEQVEFVNRACDRTDQLANFVSDLLSLTKMRLHNEYEFEEISLRDLLEKVISLAEIHAKAKSISLDLSIEKGIDKFVGNKFSLEELYSNLILNAIKYTPENGQVTVNIHNGKDGILSEIRDTGIGIPQDEISFVFDEFYRASNVKADFKAGSGLGLSIAKQIVINHNGKIWVESKLEKGTRFFFSISDAVAKEPEIRDN